ncbi:hypothetical protein [Saccharopolyspora taberi]|uniref:Uncharacterized protein n=1 Tax=Saccharopolyspora taberi TaxID=60895 RepID=A0ABN3VA79_9PSEU
MRYRRNSEDRGNSLPGSTGWLFADLMLALVVVIVMVAAVQAAPPEPPPPRPLPKPAPPTTTTNTPPPPPRLAREPVKFDVFLDYNALFANDPVAVGAARAAVQAEMWRLGGRRAGLALSFGAASNLAIGRGTAAASRFNEVVLQSMGPQFQDCSYRGYFQGSKGQEMISVEIFVFES